MIDEVKRYFIALTCEPYAYTSLDKFVKQTRMEDSEATVAW